MTDSQMSLSLPETAESHFTTVDDRRIAKRTFTSSAMLEHLEWHAIQKAPAKQVCDLDCGCHVFHMKATESNRKFTRIRFHRLPAVALKSGKVVLKFHGVHGDLQRVKMFDATSEDDRRHAVQQLQRMQERNELSEEKLQQMARLIGWGPVAVEQ